MRHYSPRVVSVRLPGDVFEALKAHAKDQGRSVSGSITHLVKEEVAPRILRKNAGRKLTGFLSHLDVPVSLEEWQAGRREVSHAFQRARKPRRRRKAR